MDQSRDRKEVLLHVNIKISVQEGKDAAFLVRGYRHFRGDLLTSILLPNTLEMVCSQTQLYYLRCI